MTSNAPTPGRPARPCTAELLAAAELPVTTAGLLAASPKLPPFRGDNSPASDPDALASIAELLMGGSLPDTVTAALMGGDPKIPTMVGD
jgi:hypothetical protein